MITLRRVQHIFCFCCLYLCSIQMIFAEDCKSKVLDSLCNVSTDKTQPFLLQILHSSDNESSFQDPNTLAPKIIHYATVLTGLRRLAVDLPSIYLTAGDHSLPGPFYQAAAEVPHLGAPGLGDIAFYNAMGLVANGIGNHEFDGGINDFARMLAQAHYPFIAANLDFSQVQLAEGVPAIKLGVDGSNITQNRGKVVKSTYIEVQGEKIGLIGRAPADFFSVIQDPATTLPGLDFVGGRNPANNQPLVSAMRQVLKQVDLLTSQGINKIILLDHSQDFTADPLSAQALRDIDIIVTAGSTGFMAQNKAKGPFNLLRPGDRAQTDYPILRKDSAGHTVVVVKSDQLYRYVGHLIVEFNSAGHIITIDPRSGPVATTPKAIQALETLLATTLTVPAQVNTIFTALTKTDLIQEQFEIIGITNSVLMGERAEVRSRETNLGRLVADATLWYGQQLAPVDIALKNGGGLRDSIIGPNITRFTVSAALAFDDQLAIVELQADELLAVMENAVSRLPRLDGRFLQLAGLFLEYDAHKPGITDAIRLSKPSRVRTLVMTRAEGRRDTLVNHFQVQGKLTRKFTLATNKFLLMGGDGYQALTAAAKARGTLEVAEIGERQILINYIQEVLNGHVNMPEPLVESRIINRTLKLTQTRRRNSL